MTKTVTGPTDDVVIVGAGLSGLAAGLYLLGSGRSVTILERADRPGGRVGSYDGPDYVIDNGATVLTMPELIADALAAVGADFASTTPQITVRQLAPAYHARFADGSTIDVHSDPDAMIAEVGRTCGPREAEGYRRMRTWLRRMFDAEFDTFMDANFDSPLDLASTPTSLANLAKVTALGGFGRLGPRIGRFIEDERLRRLFTFQALYAGVAPRKALAVYGAIPHMDTCLGVYFTDGGMRSISLALADAFTSAGGRLELRTDVHDVVFDGRRARRVRSADGREFSCDAVILTTDIGSVANLLGRRAPRRRALRASPSAVVLHGTVPAEVARRWPAQAHHTIDFGAAWQTTFAEITARRGRGSLMSDPSLLITRPALTDPGLVVERGGTEFEPLSVLAPCPNLASAPLEWEHLTSAYVRDILGVLERRGYCGIADHYTVDHVDTPQTWADQGMLDGSPFSAAHLFRQTGPFRTRNLLRSAENVVLAGCGTTPGVGVPTVLLSGKLAAARLGARATARQRQGSGSGDTKLLHRPET